MRNLTGQTIKGYELRELVGSGGFGQVYRAYQNTIEREVALKIILPEYANHPDFIRRFETEAQLIARLEHLHIVPLFDYWRDPSGAFLVMRYLRGGSLSQSIKLNGSWSPGDTAHLLEQIAGALTVAHRAGVIHRDLKPDNILLDEEENAYLADFGIAKDLTSNVHLTQREMVMGSPAYFSPEQIKGERVTPRTDVYSLGIVLYEMLTGQHPFPNLPPTTLVFKHLNEMLPSLTTHREDFSPALDEVIQRATSKDADERYPNPLSLSAAFHEALNTGRHLTPGSYIVKDTPASLEEMGVLEVKNPYKGLRAFEEVDREDFFGRQALTEHILQRLSEGESTARFLAIIGPSGSGKSSVIKASVIPALRQGAIPGSERWFIVEMIPGQHPLEELEAALLRIAVNPPPSLLEQLREDERGLVRAVKRVLPEEHETTSGSELLLLIDQFEEVFTLVNDEEERAQFLRSLYVAATEARSRLRIIITLRADLYDRPLLYPDFGRLVRARTEIVLPMSPEELQQSITGPVHRLGISLETGLVTAIVGDVSAQPGALPLLQYALTELFERREGRRLTLDAYHTIGGVFGALVSRADEIYDHLDSEGQEAARQLFLRLVTLGEGTDDSRRRIRQSELNSINVPNEVMRDVVEKFGGARLLTFDTDPVQRHPVVEIAHEALIREWRLLRRWLEESREDLRLRRILTAASAEWLSADCDPSFLATGARLEQLEDWESQTTLALTQEETDYLKASVNERQRQKNEEEARQRREQALEQRSRDRMRMLVAVLLVATLIASGLSLLALNQSQLEQQARATSDFNVTVAVAAQETSAANEAISQTQVAIAERNLEVANSLALATGAQRVLGDNFFDLALALALRSSSIQSPPPLAERMLFEVINNPGTHRRFDFTAPVNIAVFSPDGQYLLAGSSDGLVTLWDVEDNQRIARLEGHNDTVRALAFSPDGKLALTGGGSEGASSLFLWDVETQKQLRRFQGHESAVTSVAFLPDGVRALSGGFDGILILWDLQTGEEIRRFESENDIVRSVAVSPDGLYAVSGVGTGLDGDLILWDVEMGAVARNFVGHTSRVNSAVFSPDGRFVLSGSRDNTVRLWLTETGKEIRLFEGHADSVNSVAYSPDGRTAISGSDDRNLIVWDINNGAEIQRFTTHSGSISAVAFNPDDRGALSASQDNSVVVWDLASGAEIRRFIGHKDTVWAVEFSPDGRTVISGAGRPDPRAPMGQDNSIRMWDVANTDVSSSAMISQLRTFDGHSDTVLDLAFTPDGNQFVSASADTTLVLWDLPTGNQIRRYRQNAQVLTVAVSPNGNTALAGGADGSLILWSLQTDDEIRRLIGHNNSVRSVVFSTDGKRAFSGSFDGTARLWDVQTGAMIRQFDLPEAVHSVAISPDAGEGIVGLGNGDVILWNLETGRAIRRFIGHTDTVRSIAFNPDGRTVLTSSRDNSLRLWDVATGEEIRRFAGHTDWVNSVAFSPDGRMIVSGSSDTTVRLWQPFNSLKEMTDWAYANRYVRDFTCDERKQYLIEPLCVT